MKRTIAVLTLICLASTAMAADRYRHDSTPVAKAKAIIFIYLDGGSSQTDTFDPKPEAGRNYCGKYTTPISTNTPGLKVGPRLKRLAKISENFSVIRTMTNNGINAHETAHYITLSGDMSASSIVYPSFCSMISYLKEEDCHTQLFPYITLTAASTRFNEAGFLPSQYKPYDTGGDPADRVFNVDGIFSEHVSKENLLEKQAMIECVNTLSHEIEPTEESEKLHAYQDRAFKLITGDAKDVFNLRAEPDSLRQRYGMTKFGQSCLMARRLVEEGVMAVCVRFTGWDTHKEHFSRMDERLDDLDLGVSALILDLKKRGLLDSTIIVCGGEFGRTPKISFEPPWNGGRGHYGETYSYMVAGGGFKGGVIVGKTDATGEHVVSRPVYPCDLIATMYTLLGIDPNGKILHPTAGYIPLLPSYGKENTSAGMLTELIK